MEISVRTVTNMLDNILDYLKKKDIKITKYLCGKEYGKKNKNEHYHYHLELASGSIKEDSICKGIRRLLHKYYNSKNFYVKKVKDSIKHQLYVTKDGEYTHSGYTKEEIESLDEQNQEIEYDKELPIYEKLWNRINELDTDEHKGYLAIDKRWIIKQILIIYQSWNKPPPSKTSMFQYVCYIQQKSGVDIDVIIGNYNI